jgi:hypothetical protein
MPRAQRTQDARDERRIAEYIRPILERLRWDRNIDVAAVARTALDNLDLDGGIERDSPIIYLAANMGFKQVTRELLRTRWEDEDKRQPSGAATSSGDPKMQSSADENGCDSHIEDEDEYQKEYQTQLELFERYPRLQPRYPREHARGRPRGYVLVNRMSEADWNWNLDNMEGKIAGLKAHFNQLIAYGKERGFIRYTRGDAVREA